MTYQTILVPLDNELAGVCRTTAALGLARAFDCHLSGVAATDHHDLPTNLLAAGAIAHLPTLSRDVLTEHATTAALRFEIACRLAGVDRYDSVVEESDAPASFRRHAHAHDLALLSQPDPLLPAHADKASQLVDALLTSARPVLILPYTSNGQPIGRRPLVAWDDSREATRAIADALPFLKRAERVDVVCWRRYGSADRHIHENLEAIARWLGSHGIEAMTSVETTEIEVADAMLSRACDAGTDLIVMGAYGHSRIAERLLGGVSQSILATMTVPVLMSH